MIPKVIHYCWFGNNPKPKLMNKCIRSWKRFCPDYKIIEWNENNFSIQKCPVYVRQAYQEKKWAFVTDYVRLQIIYEHGGIYLDTDVQLIKPLDELLNHLAYFGIEGGCYINTGLGYGAVKRSPIIKEIMQDYQNISYIKEDGTYDNTPCPVRNTAVFLENGFEQNDCMQVLGDDILILPTEYLCPKDWKTGELHVTEKTISIHHANASWWTPEMKKKYKKKQRQEWFRHLPSMLGTRILGEKNYNNIRKKIKDGRMN